MVAYQWAVHSSPDFLALQLPPVPVVDGDRAHDALKALLTRRGFATVAPGGDDLGLRPSSGCLLTRTGPASMELLVTIGPRVGASRFPLTGLDPAWVERAVDAGHAAVLVVETSVRPAQDPADDTAGTTDRASLRADIEAGGVLGALVPSSAGDT